ncbi:hypothetical protein DXG03_004377 [Asterophora parasitica]|uniref:C2H2-type domain-containing protein n=1 Tax=Asterophora parasitica TaxID=117018 RepID=A0A9P7KD22_9AGAR|nr:hypothetical protein DXG03_004377 [Asterophora parasitica]
MASSALLDVQTLPPTHSSQCLQDMLLGLADSITEAHRQSMNAAEFIFKELVDLYINKDAFVDDMEPQASEQDSSSWNGAYPQSDVLLKRVAEDSLDEIGDFKRAPKQESAPPDLAATSSEPSPADFASAAAVYRVIHPRYDEQAEFQKLRRSSRTRNFASSTDGDGSANSDNGDDDDDDDESGDSEGDAYSPPPDAYPPPPDEYSATLSKSRARRLPGSRSLAATTCTINGCRKRFTRRADLQRHQATVHDRQTEEQIYEDTTDNRRYCMGCKKVLARKDSRERHERVCLKLKMQKRKHIMPKPPERHRLVRYIMHQEHTIPWNSAAANFKFYRDNAHFTPRRTALFARNLPTQGQTLNHFVRILNNTIETFSKTERAKYPASFHAPVSGPLFSDEVRDRYPEYLNERNQYIEYWIARARTRSSHGHSARGYTTSDGDLADVVKVLFHENQMQTLLMLAHHPQVPLSTLRNLSWGHHFGFSRVMESALHAYVLLNIFMATGTLMGGEYLETREYKTMLAMSTHGMDFPAQQLPHREYLNALPVAGSSALPEVHRDLSALKEYLKKMFSLLYRYDMVVRECGLDSDWEAHVVGLFGHSIAAGVKIEYLTIDGKGAWLFANPR